MFNKIPPADYPRRLDKTIVRYKGHPCELRVMGNERFDLRPISGDSRFEPTSILPTDPDLDIASLLASYAGTEFMGYFEGTQYAFWVERRPIRNFQQGICTRNVKTFVLTQNGLEGSHPENIYSSGFEKMILNQYDNLDNVLKKMCQKGVVSIPVSRKVALRRNKDVISVFYLREEVGWITPGTRVVHIPKSIDAWIVSKYLSELSWEID